jgi:hypothetical protein
VRSGGGLGAAVTILRRLKSTLGGLGLYRLPDVLFTLPEPIRAAESEGDLLQRYYRAYIVRARNPDDAIEVVREDGTREGARFLGSEPPTHASLLQVPAWLLPRVALTWNRGVVWRSGRVFYTDDA